MKKSFLFLFVFVMIASQSLVLLHAQEKPMYKAHFLTFTETVISHLETQLNLTREEAVARQLKTSLKGEAQLKKAISDRIPGFNGQWIFFGPNHLNYQETSKDQTITDMYGAFHDSDQPIYQAMQNLKAQYNIQNINPYIITQNANFVKKSENIMIRNVNDTYPWANYLKMITPSSWNESIQPFIAPYPDGYPGSEKNLEYGTLGATLVHKVFENFEYKGDSLVHFTNDQGQPDSILFSMGDRDIVDEFAWGNVFDTSGTALGFRTTPDTLTIKQGGFRFIELYPGWNDSQTSEVLYVGGDNLIFRRDLHPNELHCTYNQQKGFRYPETDLVAYAVEVNSITDAFAMDYILVQFVPEIEYPTLQVPDNIEVNDTFTVSLAGNPELMTSWEPEINISGIDYEFISSDNYIYTYKALSAGQATITLHHNSLLVLEDETASINVITSVDETSAQSSKVNIFPNPNNGEFDIELSGIEYNTIDLQVIDISGNSVYTEQIQNAVNNIHIEKLNLTPGTYYLKLNYNDKNIVKKFVILK